MVNFDVTGLKSLIKYAASRKKKLSDQRSTHAKAVVAIDAWIQKNFQQEGGLVLPGQGWQKLAPQTIARRRQKSSRILQDTGHLKSRWKKQWTNKRGLIQSGVPYSVFHEEGTKHIPQRKILPEEKQIMPTLIKIYGKFVRTTLHA